MESGRLIAGLARITRDVGLAEVQWPASGISDNPGAWLMHADSSGRPRARRRRCANTVGVILPPASCAWSRQWYRGLRQRAILRDPTQYR